MVRGDLDTLILGCTHYPLLRDAIGRVVGDSVALVDSAEALAQTVNSSLGDEPTSGRPGRIVHFVTGDPLAFAHTSEVIGEVAGEVVPLPVTELIALQYSNHRPTQHAARFSRNAAMPSWASAASEFSDITSLA